MSRLADMLWTACRQGKSVDRHPPIYPRCPQPCGHTADTLWTLAGLRDTPALGGASLVPPDIPEKSPACPSVRRGQPSGLHRRAAAPSCAPAVERRHLLRRRVRGGLTLDAARFAQEAEAATLRSISQALRLPVSGPARPREVTHSSRRGAAGHVTPPKISPIPTVSGVPRRLAHA